MYFCEQHKEIEGLKQTIKTQKNAFDSLKKAYEAKDPKRSPEFWEVKGALAGSKQTNKWLSENNENLKAENRRHKSSIFHSNKRHEDLMSYQDKQNEEIEKLNRAVKQLKKIQTDYVETVIRIENLRIAEEFENTKLKAENKTLRKKERQVLDMLDKDIDNRLNKEASASFCCVPLDTVDYEIDWSEWLGDDIIKESVVEVTGPGIIDKVKKTTKRLILIITGQVHGEKCYMTHSIKTKERNGIIRTGSKTIKIEVKSS